MEKLAGCTATQASFEGATETLLDNVALRTSKYRASREYREEMLRVHLPAVMSVAAERARNVSPVEPGA